MPTQSFPSTPPASHRAITALLAATLCGVAAAAPALAQTQAEAPATLIIMDGSGSMWGRIDGRPKLEIARETTAQVLARIPAQHRIGLMAYGHRTRGDCSDIELLVPPAAGTAGAIRDAVNRMRFQGRTPLTEAVRQAAEVLRSTEEPANVVLITDGIETCDADPCALASELHAAGVGFTAHVIGFGLSREEGARVACIAENTGGRYIPARDAGSLAEALAATVTGAPAPTASAPPPPMRERPRHYPGAEMMRDLALQPTGGAFGDAGNPQEISFPRDGTIDQCKTACDRDRLCGSWRYEPAGSHFVDHARCFLYSRVTEFGAHMMSPDEGWASGMKPGVIGLTRPYIAIGADYAPVSLRVPDAVAPGAEFAVMWEGPAQDGDFVDIVPQSHEELGGELTSFYVNETIETGDALEGAGTLTAPDQPGLYALRYVLGRDIDRRVLLRVPLRIGGPAGTPAAPAK